MNLECVSSISNGGLSTQPWGVPVPIMKVPDVLLPTHTACGLPVTKSRIQLHSGVLRPSMESFLIICQVMTVLNVELNSMNSILA